MMMGGERRRPVCRALIQRARSASAAALAPCALNEPTLDQLFAEPIVQQLMHCDRIDEAATRRLLQTTAAVRASPKLNCVQSAPWAGGIFALAIGLLLVVGIRNARNVTLRT